MRVFATGVGALLMTLLGSLLLIFIGLAYFVFTLWIVKLGSSLVGYAPDANYAVLSAALISIGSMVGSALSKR